MTTRRLPWISTGKIGSLGSIDLPRVSWEMHVPYSVRRNEAFSIYIVSYRLMDGVARKVYLRKNNKRGYNGGSGLRHCGHIFCKTRNRGQ